MTKFSDIFKQVDEQWIAEHPELMMETFRLLCAELDRRSEIIQEMREKELLLTAMVYDKENN